MKKLKWLCTTVYEDLSDAIDKGIRIIALEGGSRSSKTTSILQKLVEECMNGETITVAREKFTWVKDTVLVDFEDLCKRHNLNVYPDVNRNRQTQEYTIDGKGMISFVGLDDAQKLHGRKQGITWINEAIESKRAAFDQLEMRTTKYMIIDYNPSTDKHWIFDSVLRRPDSKLLKSTMLNNPFLPDAIVEKILSYKPTIKNIRNGTADKYMWDVYGQGIRAKLKGAIFTNWDIVSSIPEDAKLIGYGLDFGYTNDPTSVCAVYLFNNEIYADQLIYSTGLTNDNISQLLRENGISNSNMIYADSAEPKSIDEISSYGWSIVGATKGQGSINYGIDILKQYRIHLTERSIKAIEEFRNYKWKQDSSGKALNIPFDANNHFCDSLRYCAMETLRKFEPYEEKEDEDEIKPITAGLMKKSF